MDNDLFPMQSLKLIAVCTLIVVTIILALLSIWLAPKIRIWREKFAIWRRDDREFRAELERRRRAQDAWRFGLAPMQRQHKPLTCACCGSQFDAIAQAVTHRCIPTEDTQ